MRISDWSSDVCSSDLPAPALSMPDFTSIVAKTEGSVVNTRTTEAVPVRPTIGGPDSNDPYNMFRWFSGPDFMPPGMRPPHRSTPNTPNPKQKERTVPHCGGSGFFISRHGTILPNTHVVEDSNGDRKSVGLR